MKKMWVMFVITFSVFGCGTAPKDVTRSSRNLDGGGNSIPGIPKPALALIPKARYFTGEIAPVITQVNPGSVAQKYGFKKGDQILFLNREKILSAAQFDEKIRHAESLSQIYFKRNGRVFKTKVPLGMERPRFGANFEPEGIAYVKKTSPFVSFMRQKDMTAFAETSLNEDQDQLRVNIIFNTPSKVNSTKVKYSVFDKGTKKSVAAGTDSLPSLGSSPCVFSKAFKKGSGFKGPIWVSLQVDGKQFRFEFQ